MKLDLDVHIVDLLIEAQALQILSYEETSGGIPSAEDVVSGRFRERRKSTVFADLLGIPIKARFDRPPRPRNACRTERRSARNKAARAALAVALGDAWSGLPKHVIHRVIRILNRPE